MFKELGRSSGIAIKHCQQEPPSSIAVAITQRFRCQRDYGFKFRTLRLVVAGVERGADLSGSLRTYAAQIAGCHPAPVKMVNCFDAAAEEVAEVMPRTQISNNPGKARFYA